MNEEEKRLAEGIVAGEPSSAPKESIRWKGSSLSLEDFNLLNEEIAGMAQAGLPLDQGLAALAREMGQGKLRRVTAAIAADLQAGQTLPQALERQSGALPAFYAHLMAAGIRAGKLGDALTTLTVYSRAMADLRAMIFGAFLYPMIVLAISSLLLIGLIIFLVPMFDEIFKGFRMKLPAVTEMMMHVSRHPVYYFLLPAITLALVFVSLRIYLAYSPKGQERWARLQNGIPLLGMLIRSARMAAFTDLLGILVDNGLPLPEAFRLAGDASRDPLLASGARHVEEELTRGTSLGRALSGSSRVPVLPEVIGWMIGQGQKTNTLGATLHRLADMYRRQAERRAILLRNILPSFLIVLVAVTIGGLFVIAMLMPMIGLLDSLSGGKR